MERRKATAVHSLPPTTSVMERSTFRNMENFGWDLWFVRSRGKPEQKIVLRHDTSRKTAILTADGWDENHGIVFRA